MKSRAPLLVVALCACVPPGNSSSHDAGPSTAQSSSLKPSLNIMTGPFEDNFDRPDAGEAIALPGDASGVAPTLDAAVDAARREVAHSDASLLSFADAAAEVRPVNNLGPNWTAAKTNAWRIENGRLCGENAQNHGVWLNRTLPVNARIEFDAVSTAPQGDLKAELWGDGRSYATGSSYTNATSYIVILGGWNNTIHALARLNEHGKDRKEITVDKNSDDSREHPVVRDQLYQFKIERTDGKTIKVWVNGSEYFSWTDPAPLAGQGHDHMGFNDWQAKVCFDNVRVTPL